LTAPFPVRAAQYARLLHAIADKPATSRGDLAERGGVLVSNLNRRLDDLAQDGLITPGAETHLPSLTAEGARALAAVEAYETGAALAPPAGETRLDLDLVDPNPWQPRRRKRDAAQLEELARSIADNDVQQPVKVRPSEGGRYQLVFGEGRLEAAKLARAQGWVPADFTLRAMVAPATDEEMEDLALVENVQREDLHWLDEGEAYLRQAARGRSAADIIRLFGAGGRKKRSVQILIQIARELTPEQKDRCYLPEGDPERISVEAAKVVVGSKRPAPAFDLTPRLACALVELLDAGGWDGEQLEGLGPGGVVTCRTPLFARPSTAALVTLGDKGLVKFGVAERSPVADVQIGAEMAAWLGEQGFDDDRAACLRALRTATIGELAAGALEAGARYDLAELNPPTLEAQRREDPDAGDDEAEAETPAYLRRLAGGGPLATDGAGRTTPQQPDLLNPAPPPKPAAPEPPAVKPEHRLAVIELAHRIGRSGVDTQMGAAAPVGEYHLDPLYQALVFARLAMFSPGRDGNVALLTPTAKAWLEAHGFTDADGAPDVTDEALLLAQTEAGHDVTALAAPYVTAWLNPPAEPAPGPEVQMLAPGERHQERGVSYAEAGVPLSSLSPSPGVTADMIAAPDWQARAERAERALGALAAAARAAYGALRDAKTGTKAPKASTVDPVLALLEHALAATDVAMLASATSAEAAA
jgi:ParB/RepB/Spo0J family partition protein